MNQVTELLLAVAALIAAIAQIVTAIKGKDNRKKK